MSDDPHPCMKVTSHIRNFMTMTAAAVIQEQNVPQIISDDECNSSNLILCAENIAASNLNHKKHFSDDLRPYLLAPVHSGHGLRITIGKARFFARRFSFN